MAEFDETYITLGQHTKAVTVSLDVRPTDVIEAARSVGMANLTYDEAKSLLYEVTDEVQDDPEYEESINWLHAVVLKHVGSCVAREAEYRQ